MTTLSRNIKRSLPGLALLLAAATCQAGSVQLTPVRINLSEAAKVAVLTVRNTGTEASVMQVSLNKWTLEGQDYAYKSSHELVITPATFKLAPGRQQIVRIGMRGAAPAAKEGSDRLLVEEVPPPAALGVTGTRLVVRHDLPVFIAPTATALPSLDIAMDCSTGGGMLHLTNIGNVHAQLRNVVLGSAVDGPVLARWDTAEYLLPNAKKSWGLAKVAPAVVGKSFVVTTLTDQGSFTADVANTCT